MTTLTTDIPICDTCNHTFQWPAEWCECGLSENHKQMLCAASEEHIAMIKRIGELERAIKQK